MRTGRDRIVVIGASARAAAYSAQRAGLEPYCADLFADLDLARRACVTRIAGADYPGGLEIAARAAPPGPWVYTGAMENYPELVRRVAGQRPLWGNGADTLCRVRNPFAVAHCLAQAGLPHPKVRHAAADPPSDRRWLIKPLAGSGGRGIRPLGSRPTDRSLCPGTAAGGDPFFLQEYLEGDPCACLFVANGRHCTLLGLTEQLIALPQLYAAAYHYCGSVGPLAPGRQLSECCEAIGQALTAEFGLIGLFGVDCIRRDQEIWPVEVNPRYTASAEIVEHALGHPALAWHRDACVAERLPDRAGTRVLERGANRTMLGKAVLYAPARICMADLGHLLDRTLERSGGWTLPVIADVPRPRTIIERGHPIMTVFAIGRCFAECKRNLLETARQHYSGLLAHRLIEAC